MYLPCLAGTTRGSVLGNRVVHTVVCERRSPGPVVNENINLLVLQYQRPQSYLLMRQLIT